MSDATGKSAHVSESHGAEGAQSTSTNTTKQAQALAASMDTGTFSSLSDLKAKSPKLYNFMMQSIAQNICIQIKRQQEKLAQKWKEMRRD